MKRTLIPLLLLTIPALLPAQVQEWTLEEIFGGEKFRMASLASPQWVEGGKGISFFRNDPTDGSRDIVVYDVASGSTRVVVDGSELAVPEDSSRFSMTSYSWSPDFRSVLLTGTLVARTRKTGGNFAILETESGRLRLMTGSDEQQSIIKYSPSGEKIGFVRSNNLFVVDATSGEETQLTFDGSETVLNGVFDWVYEEEFSIIDAWEWSPDSRFIAFWRLDQSGVPTFPIIRYPENDVHPLVETQSYPKAGDPVSAVRIGVVDLAAMRTAWVDLGVETDMYVPRITWTNRPGVLSVQRLNRGQDTLDLLLADAADGSSRVILTETDPSWIDAEDGVIDFLKESDRFIWSSFRDGFNHLYLYDLDGNLERQLTRGAWEVEEYHGTDERRGVVYYASTERSPLERHLYRVDLDGRRRRQLTKEPGWHSCSLAPGKLVLLDSFSSTQEPETVVLRSNDGEEIAVLAANPQEMFTGYRFGSHRFITIPTSDGELLNGWMITPPGFDRTRRYPVLLYVYGGPGSQRVVDRWGGPRYLWFQLLAGRGYIVACVDNRGTGGRGKVFMQQTFRRIGIREVDDYVETADYLRTLSYVDPARIGICGWSGGGFMTSLAMTYAAGAFKTGMAMSPVTDWRFYDAIYTERYMEQPAENPEGYRITSPIHHAAKMNGNLLIVHALADDNVHWQNTVLFVEELIRQNKPVTTMFYPERRHTIAGRNGTLHLYTLLTEYLLKHL